MDQRRMQQRGKYPAAQKLHVNTREEVPPEDEYDDVWPVRMSSSARRYQGLADVNPIFTWVRLAQRIPVRIHIDHVPDGVKIVAGQTCTIVLDRGRKSEADP